MTLTTGPGGSPRGPEFVSPGIEERAAGGGGGSIGIGSIGIGFAVPIDRARQVATTLIGRG